MMQTMAAAGASLSGPQALPERSRNAPPACVDVQIALARTKSPPAPYLVQTMEAVVAPLPGPQASQEVASEDEGAADEATD